jgi:outer membrane protein OmpA-like peptidoglycan-associated protein
MVLSGVTLFSPRRTMFAPGARADLYFPFEDDVATRNHRSPPMKNRMSITPWPGLRSQRKSLAGTCHTISTDPVDDRAGRVKLSEIWRGWEAGTSSEFLNWFLRTPHGRLPTAETAVLEDWICFEEDRWELGNSARAVLGDRLKLLRANPSIRIVIGGLAGRSGSIAHGMRLGLRRVTSVRTFLLAAAIDPDRIGIAVRGPGWQVVERSMGSEDPMKQGREYRLQLTDPLWALARN